MNIKENVKKVAINRELSFCYKKLAEELFELGEVVMKQLNKPRESEERIPHLVEEIGDVILNASILSCKLNINNKVFNRIKSKLDTLI